MEILSTEEQQIAAIKQWWKENGSSVVTGVVLGLALLFAGKAWFAHQESTAQSASNIYTAMMNALQGGDSLAAGEKAAILLADYSGTPYASLAALALARLRMEEGALDAARGQLQWVLDNDDSGFLRDIARLRLARVLVAGGELDAAGKLVAETAPGGAYDALYAELRGDIARARGDQAAAAEAYRLALAETAADSPGRELLQLKYTDARAAAPAGTENTESTEYTQ